MAGFQDIKATWPSSVVLEEILEVIRLMVVVMVLQEVILHSDLYLLLKAEVAVVGPAVMALQVVLLVVLQELLVQQMQHCNLV